MHGPNSIDYDVIVIGGGNAGLCAALSASKAGSKVLLIEKAPIGFRGGNCPYTGGGFRFVHNGKPDLEPLLSDSSSIRHVDTIDPYTADQYRRDMLERTGHMTNPDLLDQLISQSYPTVQWMTSLGVSFELSGSSNTGAQVRPDPRVGVRALGSGIGLLNMLYKAAEQSGVVIVYETKMVSLLENPLGEINGVICKDKDGTHRLECYSVVLACGGFEANQEMRLKYLGPAWELAKVRGSMFNTGDGHRAALSIGAKPVGQWSGCHGTPIDLDAPNTGSPASVDRLPRRSYTYGIMLNLRGERFVDEGKDFALSNFIEMGSMILSQPMGIAIQLFDNKTSGLLEERYGSSEVICAQTIQEMAEKLGLDARIVEATISNYNNSVQKGMFDPERLDGKCTVGIYPPKTNWATRLDTPPYRAYKVTGGIAYTFGGINIDIKSRVQDTEDTIIPGLYAAGEIVGGFFYYDSLRASGLMHGAVFGRISGLEAANRAMER